MARLPLGLVTEKDVFGRQYVAVEGDVPLTAEEVPESIRAHSSSYTFIIPVPENTHVECFQVSPELNRICDVECTGHLVIVRGSELQDVLDTGRRQLKALGKDQPWLRRV